MNENTQGRFILIERALLENVVATLRHVNVRDDDFDSMDRLVGCVGVLTRNLMNPPAPDLMVKPEENGEPEPPQK